WIWNGCWEIGGAALWQQHCISGFDYAELTNGTNVQLSEVSPKFNWGFKVWGSSYSGDGCSFASVAWRHLWSRRDSATVAAGTGRVVLPAFYDVLMFVATRRQRAQY